MKSFRNECGTSTPKNMFRLGTFAETGAREGVSDPWSWVQEELVRRNEEERPGRQALTIGLSPTKRIKTGGQSRYSGGNLMLIPLYNALVLPRICRELQKETRAEYSLNWILGALAVLRILYSCPKKSPCELNQKRIRSTSFALEDVYRALTLIAGHIDDIQSRIWRNSQKIMARNTCVIYY